ncbi:MULTISPECIES: helix-turn-helix domain-containing protein [Bacillus]|uniref:helix-turn-helix domain-containing protein n=1 Tax=Bacillus TaxID=1386 RepID=UPI0009929D9D|nr:helix-turn-helix domain-containing protein [Bacillus cereus]
MTMNTASTFRIYPNQAQAIPVNKKIDWDRFVCNLFLSIHTKNRKKEFVWLKEENRIVI